MYVWQFRSNVQFRCRWQAIMWEKSRLQNAGFKPCNVKLSRKIPICTRYTATHQLLWQQQHTCSTVGGSSMERGVGDWADNPTRLRTIIPDTGAHTLGMTLPRRAWVRLNRLRTGVGRFCSCLYKWGMASSADCECGAEEQTVDHVVLQYPIRG